MHCVDQYIKILNEIKTIVAAHHRDSSSVNLIVVTKNHSWDQIKPLYDYGVRDFGENRVQELLEKIEIASLSGVSERLNTGLKSSCVLPGSTMNSSEDVLSNDRPAHIRWHFIGSLQKNKVRKIIGKCALIHSVDTPELAKKISEVSFEMGLKTSILLQVNTSGELTKHGLNAEEWFNSFAEVAGLPNIAIEGLMTMAPNTEDRKLIRSCFSELRMLRDRLKGVVVAKGLSHELKHLSMGMSQDYQIAIEEGATLVRVGSAIFGG